MNPKRLFFFLALVVPLFTACADDPNASADDELLREATQLVTIETRAGELTFENSFDAGIPVWSAKGRQQGCRNFRQEPANDDVGRCDSDYIAAL